MGVDPGGVYPDPNSTLEKNLRSGSNFRENNPAPDPTKTPGSESDSNTQI